ncbi:MAG: alpha/beta hydrolase [Acidobacteriota bacterium]
MSEVAFYNVRSLYDPGYIEHFVAEPNQRRRRVPLFFLHGAHHGAWCWEWFLRRFVTRGYECHVISLPGHLKSSLEGKRLNRYRLRNYVDCLAREVGPITPAPVLVSHGMGGAIVARYLAGAPQGAPAAVFLSPVPAGGTWRSGLRGALRHPLAALRRLVTDDPRHLIGSPRLVARRLLSGERSIHPAAYHQRLGPESSRVARELWFARSVRWAALNLPTLNMAGDRDRLFTVAEQRRLAHRMDSEFRVWPGRPHALMLTPQWEEIVDYIDEWLAASGIR